MTLFRHSLPITTCALALLLAAKVAAQSDVHAAQTHINRSPIESTPVNPHLADEESSLLAQLATRPNSAELLYQLAHVEQRLGKARLSLDHFTAAARLAHPTSAQLHSVALDYVLLHDYDDAIHWLEVAVSLDPQSTDNLYALGRCYFSRDRYTDAAAAFQRVLSIDPHHLKARENLGLALAATDQNDAAEDALRTAMQWADPHSSDEWPYLDYGSFLLDNNRPAEALPMLQNAARIRPTSALCHERLGRALLATHNAAAAAPELQQAVTLDPTEPKFHFEFGRALREIGNSDGAREQFTISQKLYSEHSHE